MKKHRSMRVGVAGGLLAAACLGSTVSARADGGPPGEKEKVHDVTTARGSDMRVTRPAPRSKVSQDYVSEAASQGFFVDSSEVFAAAIDDVGTVAGVDGLRGVREVTRIEATVEEEGVPVAETEAFNLQTSTPDDPVTEADKAAYPMGPGAFMETIREGGCTTLTGPEDSGNQMTWCYKQKYLDGGDTAAAGNELQPYGEWDDDGNRYRDYHLYSHTATARPSDNGIDSLLVQAHIFSWPNYNTIEYRNSRLTGYEPDAADCEGNGQVDLDVKIISVSLGACSGGTDISIASDDGRFKQYWTCGATCPDSSRSLSFRVGASVKQNTVPLWLDDNYAKFRKQFTADHDVIDD